MFCRTEYRATGRGYEPPSERILQRQSEATDRQIDRLVYELYDLTEEEAAPGVPFGIVEGAGG